MFLLFNNYAALEEVNQTIPLEQLKVLQNQLESESPNPSPQSEFNYAWGLLKSPRHKDQNDGIKILSHLYKDVPSMRREALYYLALGSFKVGEYSNARKYADALVDKEPSNTQFQALKKAIEDKITQDGFIGIGVAGGVLALGVGLLSAFARKRK